MHWYWLAVSVIVIVVIIIITSFQIHELTTCHVLAGRNYTTFSPYIIHFSEIAFICLVNTKLLCREALELPGCDAIHATEVECNCICDTFFPKFDKNIFRIWYSSSPKVENNIRYMFRTYVRENSRGGSSQDNQQDNLINRLPKSIRESHEEYQYLNLIQDIIYNGAEKGDRTCTGTLSKFGCQVYIYLHMLCT
jgi:dihydrofolate reductase/thymidylate synthase